MKKLLVILTLIGIIFINLNEVFGFNGERNPDTSSSQKVLIKGTIIDSLSNEPLTGTLIQTETDGTQVYSNFNGNFKIKVYPNEKVKISLISYKNKKISLKKINLSKDTLIFHLNKIK